MAQRIPVLIFGDVVPKNALRRQLDDDPGINHITIPVALESGGSVTLLTMLRTVCGALR